MCDIKIAYCFDENLINQVRVTIAALLDARGKDEAHYHIYCVCTRKAAKIAPVLERIVHSRDVDSSVCVVPVENQYERAYKVRGISTGTYLRLMLHRLLPDVDRILYMDVDTFVREDLTKIWDIDMQDYYLAGVKAAVNITDKWEWNSDRPYWHLLEKHKGGYINAGVTLMNLQKIREDNLEEQWSELAKQKLYYQDQDILNITCQKAIFYLPPTYNRFAYFSDEKYQQFIQEGLYTVEECKEATTHPAIIHYAGDKPWKRYDGNLCSLWWDYVNSQTDLQGLFDEAKARRYHGPTFWEKVVRRLQKMLSKEKL